MKTKFHLLAVMAILTTVLVGLPSQVSASDPSLQLYAGGNDPDGVPVGQSTYNVFYDHTFTYSYSGGAVCLSSQDGQCTSPAIDDEVILTVNGTTLNYLSYTHDFGPVDLTSYMHVGNNTVRVQLVDRIGPSRGGSQLWLVSGNASTPVVEVSIQRTGDFFSPDGSGGVTAIEGQPRANVPFRVTITKDGSPVYAELQQLQPFDAYGGTTNNGISDGSVAVSIPPQNGDVMVQYQAIVDGITSTSQPTLLYHVDTLYYKEDTITSDDVKSWGGTLFSHYFLDSDIPTPEIKIRGVGGYEAILEILIALLKTGAGLHAYSPQAGDITFVGIYQFSAPNTTTSYLYREAVIRNGNLIYDYNYFTNDRAKLDDSVNFSSYQLAHNGLSLWLMSPATLFATNPNGLSAGVEPITGQRIFEYPMALDEVGEEPYRTFIPNAPNGKYTIQVTGTDSGTYTFSTYSLTESGLATTTISATGLTHLGYITVFEVDYQAESTVPVTLSVVGTVDIVPQTLNLGSKSGPNSITAFIELPLGFDVNQIDIKTIRLAGIIPAQLSPTSIGDHNNNGIPDLMIKFNRQLLVNYLKTNNLYGNDVELKITGNYSATVLFTSTDSLVVLKK